MAAFPLQVPHFSCFQGPVGCFLWLLFDALPEQAEEDQAKEGQHREGNHTSVASGRVCQEEERRRGEESQI